MEDSNYLNEARNYYEVLEISLDASQEEVHRAYSRAKNAYSGDNIALYSLMSADDCNKILELVEEAYSIIGIPEKRREYDRARGLNQPKIEMHDSRNTLFQTELNTHQDKSLTSQTFEPSKENEDKEKDFSIYRNESAGISKISASNRFSLSYDRDSQFEQEIETSTDFTGDFLKRIREYKNVDIKRLSEMTRISKTYITNIEEDQYQKLPATPYARGFVYQYAKCLKLNPELVATSYMRHLKKLKDDQQ